jgi:hypothetical protein
LNLTVGTGIRLSPSTSPSWDLRKKGTAASMLVLMQLAVCAGSNNSPLFLT